MEAVNKLSDIQKVLAERAYQNLAEGKFNDLLQEVSDLKSKRILDAGCGQSQLIKGVSRFEPEFIVGMDIDTAFLGFSRTRNQANNIMFVNGDIENLPFKTSTFEVIFCRAVLPYVFSESKTIKEIARVLTIGGTLLLELHCIGYYIHRLLIKRPFGLRYDMKSLLSGLIHHLWGKKILVEPDTYQIPNRIKEILNREEFQILRLYQFDRWLFLRRFFRVIAKKR